MLPARVYFFWISSPAKSILFGKFVEFSQGKIMLFGNLGQRNVKIREFQYQSAKIWQVLRRKRHFRALLMENLSGQGYHFHKNWSSQRFHFEIVGGTPLPEI